MSSTPTFPIPHNQITPTQIQACVAFYQTVLERVYKATRPKSNLDEILEDDRWRYDVLPRELAGGDGRSLTKEEVQRLVKWKITHGTYRPFLPSMIAKNTPEEVAAATAHLPSFAAAFRTTTDPNTIRPALQKTCTLKGVGPATGSLVLSVYAPKQIPFFEDELFEWIDADGVGTASTGDGKGKKKLKYDLKEYDVMLAGVRELMERIGGEVEEVEARDVEKVGYVMGHLDVLGKEERSRILEGLSKGHDAGGVGTGKGEDVVGGQVKGGVKVGREEPVDGKGEKENEKKGRGATGKVYTAKRALERGTSDTLPSSSGTRRSKRVKK